MSETTEAPKRPLSDEERARLREQLSRGRQTAVRNRALRKAEARTADDARLAAPPTTAERAEPPREVSLPEAPTRRRSREERSSGWNEVPAREKKSGWDYQWMTIRVLNEPVDGARLRDFHDNGGWQMCRAKDHPSLVDRGASPDAAVETEGQRLYTRPMSLTLDAKQEDYNYALQQQRDRMQAAASGESIPSDRRGVRSVPLEIQIVGEAG